MLSTRLLRLLLSLSLLWLAASLRAERFETVAPEEEEDDLFDEPFWSELAGKLQASVDGGTLLRARRWGNIANGALLGTTGPIALLVSAVGLRLPQALLAGYLTALGATLVAIETRTPPVAEWVESNMRFLATQQGRTALLAVSGGLAWAFGKTVALAAVLTCGNALFNGYFDRILRFVGAGEAHDYEPDDEPAEPPTGLEEDMEYAAGLSEDFHEESHLTEEPLPAEAR